MAAGIPTRTPFLDTNGYASREWIKYFISSAGQTGSIVFADQFATVQAAINATPAGGTLFFPTGDYVLTGGSSTELLLVSKPIKMVGAGLQSRLLVPASVGSLKDVIRVLGNATYPIGFGFKDLAIIPQSGTPARYGINFDTTTDYIAYGKIEHCQIGGFGNYAIVTTNPTRVDGFFIIAARDNIITNGINLERAGDNISLYHNTFTGTNDIRINLVPGTDGGAHGFELIGNNITVAGGVHVLNASTGIIANNNIESPVASTSANSALLDIDGSAIQHVLNLKILNNYLGASGTVQDTIRLNYADNTLISGNYSVRNLGKTYRITANATYTIISNDLPVPFGELPTTFLDDLGSNTTFDWTSPVGQRYFGTVANKKNRILIPNGSSQGTSQPFQVTDSLLVQMFEVFANGNVGVATAGTDSGAKFQVIGSSFLNGSLTVGGVLTMNQDQDIDARDSANTAVPILSARTADNVVRIGYQSAPASNGFLLLFANGAEKARINAGGELMIGTTTPIGGSTKLTVSGNANLTGSLVVGSGTALTKAVVYAPSLTPASCAANTSAEQTFTVTGLTTSDKVIVNGPAPTAGTGIVNVRVSAADTLAITFANFTAGTLTPVSGTYSIVAVRS